MIAFIDSAPVIEPYGDVFLITATSGGEEIKLMLTFKGVAMLGARCKQAVLERAVERQEEAAKIVPFPKRPKSRAKR